MAHLFHALGSLFAVFFWFCVSFFFVCVVPQALSWIDEKLPPVKSKPPHPPVDWLNGVPWVEPVKYVPQKAPTQPRKSLWDEFLDGHCHCGDCHARVLVRIDEFNRS